MRRDKKIGKGKRLNKMRQEVRGVCRKEETTRWKEKGKEVNRDKRHEVKKVGGETRSEENKRENSRRDETRREAGEMFVAVTEAQRVQRCISAIQLSFPLLPLLMFVFPLWQQHTHTHTHTHTPGISNILLLTGKSRCKSCWPYLYMWTTWGVCYDWTFTYQHFTHTEWSTAYTCHSACCQTHFHSLHSEDMLIQAETAKENWTVMLL